MEDMLYSRTIAGRIESLCKRKSLSINRLAKMSGLNQSTVDSIIHGNSQNPKLITIHKIAYAFGMTVSEFLDFPEMDAISFEDDDKE